MRRTRLFSLYIYLVSLTIGFAALPRTTHAEVLVGTVTVESTTNTLDCGNKQGYGDCDDPLLANDNSGCYWGYCSGITSYAVPFDIAAGEYRASVVSGGIDVWAGSCGSGTVQQKCTRVSVAIPSAGTITAFGDSSCSGVYDVPVYFSTADETIYFYHCDSDNNNNVGSFDVEIWRIDTDHDFDGYDAIEFSGDDCDDGDPAVYPGAEEICDGKDNDCNGEVDEGLETYTWYSDVDGDGYGDPDDMVEDCALELPGFVMDGTDCIDENDTVFPGADELEDGLDNNCNGLIDEGTGVYDDDGDGVTEQGGDCDDTDATIYPGAEEVPYDGIDQDCDGVDLDDQDGDGFAGGAGPDCDDLNAEIHPEATEVCNGVDDDCDGAVDEEVLETYYADTDGDGFGDPEASQEGCTPSEGFLTDSTDCDDTKLEVYPGATEVCDTLDNDCDGEIDEDVQPTWYADADGDGFGDPESPSQACQAPEGTVADNTDCDDEDSTVYPGAEEVPGDEIDNDCDGVIDPSPTPGPTPTPETSPTPTAEPSPTPTLETSPTPTQEPSPTPTPETSPPPTAEPSQPPTAEPSPAATQVPTPESTPEPTAEVSPEPTPADNTTPDAVSPTPGDDTGGGCNCTLTGSSPTRLPGMGAFFCLALSVLMIRRRKHPNEQQHE